MNLTIAVTPLALKAIGRVLECKKSILLSGHTPYIDQAHATACENALYLLMYANQGTTGMAAMQREVDAIEADENGEFAAQRERLAIDADLHNDLDKPSRAHLKQTLNAVRLQMNNHSGYES